MGCNEGLNTVTGQLAKQCASSPIALEIRNQALEDAALLCEAMANKNKVDADCLAKAFAMLVCAEMIRSEKLK